MLRIVIPSVFAVLAASAVQAEVVLNIPLETGANSSVITATYSCAGGAPFQVQYVNAGENMLAILPVDGAERVFVNVVSGSGARYASGAHIWWSKGESATLEDEMAEGSLKDCVSQDYPTAP